jgi:hypothetical protein
MVAAKQAKERGNASEAERLCVDALQYVDASAIRSLYEYAALLQSEDARARADSLRQAKTQPGSSVFLGWSPSDELRAYADLLRERDRGTEVEAIMALANAYLQAQGAHAARLREQARGGDPRGTC